MNENLLQYIWRFRLYDAKQLTAESGEPIEVLHPGLLNTNAGPDFFNAKVKIGDTLWVGNVELHVREADWSRHDHDNDRAYDNVILHVVYDRTENSGPVNGVGHLPLLVLKNRIDHHLISRYEELRKGQKSVPCSRFLPGLSLPAFAMYLDALLIERLEQKVIRINDLLRQCGNDWEFVLFQMLSRYMGAGLNQEPFSRLAGTLPVKVWAKHLHHPLQIEALLFGQGGFLETDFTDEYPKTLKREYNYLKRLHSLTPLPLSIWKFMRLRPAGFPTIRLAQLAALMAHEYRLFSVVLETKDLKSLRAVFKVEVSDYWKTHYRFDAHTPKAAHQLGTSAINTLLINAVIPVLFAYGKYKGDEQICERALHMLEGLDPEQNKIIREWVGLGFRPANAAQTQSLLQLRKEYCEYSRCLECSIGHKIIR